MYFTVFLTPPYSQDRIRLKKGARAAAFISYPEGCTSYECTAAGMKKLRAFALEHGTSWSRFARIHHSFKNGQLCLVTSAKKLSPRSIMTGYYHQSLLGGNHIDSSTLRGRNSLGFWGNLERIARRTHTFEIESPRTDLIGNSPAYVSYQGFHISIRPELYHPKCADHRKRWSCTDEEYIPVSSSKPFSTLMNHDHSYTIQPMLSTRICMIQHRMLTLWLFMTRRSWR